MALAAAVCAGYPAVAAEVTPERLLNAESEPQNWLLPYGNYRSHMNSSLSQINRDNVAGLRPIFLHSIGGTAPGGTSGEPRAEATPLVNDGFMYVINGWSEVMKIDVRSGDGGTALWIFDPKQDPATMRLRKRGLAILGNYVYNNTEDARLIKLDAETGEPVWEVSTKAAEATPNQLNSSAPLAIGDKILVGQSNGDGATRGWIAAFNAETGEQEWRFWVVPSPGEPGSETWKDDHNAYETGGGAIWSTGTYDAETNTVLYGTGNAVPWGDPAFRPGDNLFTSSVVALDVDTGALKWYFQEVPNETWDWDTVNPRILYDITVDGQTRQVQGNFSRNGHYYTLDRRTGEFLFGRPYVDVNWTAGLDPKTGKPVEYDPNADVQAYVVGKNVRPGEPESGLNMCPFFYGMPTYFPSSFDQERMRAYSTATEGCFNQDMQAAVDRTQQWLGKAMPHVPAYTIAGNPHPTGVIVGVDVLTGEKVLSHQTPLVTMSGILGTAGGLIFLGHLDGRFAAYDKDTLDEVWHFNTGTPITAASMSYEIDGKQYIAVIAGGQRLGQPVMARPELDMVKRNSQVIVFGL